MRRGDIHPLTARFTDCALEFEYRRESWPILRTQFALTLAGLSVGLLVTLNSDFSYLIATDWFLPTAGLRGTAGVTALILAAWLLIVRPVREDQTPRMLVQAWLILLALTAIMVAVAFPAIEKTPDGRSDVLVFTAYWMSIFAIVVGFGFSPYPGIVAVFCISLATTYISLSVAYWETGAYPKISQTILVLMACAFGWIMALVTGVRSRRRFHLTKMYEEARGVAETGLAFQTFLLAATGHDMRQPVYALDLNAASLAAAVERGDFERVSLLARRQREVARNVTGMLSSILRLSQIDTGRATLMSEAISANALLNDAIEPLRDLAAERGLEIRIVSTTLTVLVDRSVAVHILSNLTANAISHSGGTRLVCGVRRRSGEADIVLIDDGVGAGPKPFTLTALDDLSAGPEAVHPSGFGMEIMFRLAERGGLKLRLSSRPGRGVGACLTCHLIR